MQLIRQTSCSSQVAGVYIFAPAKTLGVADSSLYRVLHVYGLRRKQTLRMEYLRTCCVQWNRVGSTVKGGDLKSLNSCYGSGLGSMADVGA